MTTNFEVLSDLRCTLGECPRWHETSRTLYWLDINTQTLYQFESITSSIHIFQLPEPISAFAFHQSGSMILTARDRILIANPDLTEFEMLAAVNLPADARFNDAAVDPVGRLWAGTLNSEFRPENHLYCVDLDSTVQPRDRGIRTANGIGWSPGGETMYFADTRALVIYAYDFDTETGALTNRRAFASFDGESGTPDGLTVDADGAVWCALWDGWRVERYLPDGTHDLQVSLPIARPTACAFGGDDLQTLYVTSATYGLSDDQLAEQPLAGATFAVPLKITGLGANLSQHLRPCDDEPGIDD
ncbi:MAG: SMP-30/gluconolactonase/LRE family protein [Chloroflexota bacterium]